MLVKWHDAVPDDDCLRKYLVIKTELWDCTYLPYAKLFLINTIILIFNVIISSLIHQNQWRGHPQLEKQERSWGLSVKLWLTQGKGIQSIQKRAGHGERNLCFCNGSSWIIGKTINCTNSLEKMVYNSSFIGFMYIKNAVNAVWGMIVW